MLFLFPAFTIHGNFSSVYYLLFVDKGTVTYWILKSLLTLWVGNLETDIKQAFMQVGYEINLGHSVFDHSYK